MFGYQFVLPHEGKIISEGAVKFSALCRCGAPQGRAEVPLALTHAALADAACFSADTLVI